MARKLALGRITSVTKFGYAVVEIENPNQRIRLGSRVVDAEGREVGRVADVIGNVEKPYAVIRLSREVSGLEGGRLFIILRPRRRPPRRQERKVRRREHGRRGREKTSGRGRKPRAKPGPRGGRRR